MSGEVRVDYKYDGLVLTCDSATLDRLHALLMAELGDASPVLNRAAIRYITIRVDTPVPEVRMGWLSLIAGILAAAVSIVVFIAGWVTVVGWFWK